MVDEDIRTEVEKWNWYVDPAGYVRGGNGRFLHALAWRLYGGEIVPQGCEIDHINRNPIDNRRCNLRVLTFRGQKLNRRDPSSRVRRHGRKWRVQIDFYGPGKFVATFDDYGIAVLTAKVQIETLIQKEIVAYV